MKYNFKVPCRKEKLKEIRSFVKKVLSQHGLSEVDMSTIVLAIDEVCANLIIHSHGCNPKESIEIDINVDIQNNFTFDIIDKAEMFNINEYNAPSLEELIKNKRKGGIGLILVKKIMDSIQIITKNNHNICRLTKKINRE